MKMKKELSEENKTRLYRRIINHLNKIAKDHKQTMNNKYKIKLEHIKNKYGMNQNDVGCQDDETPEDLVEYGDLSVFSDAT